MSSTTTQNLIKYWGGKADLAKLILEYMPQHRVYAEHFCGGASVFWAKGKAETEVINDANMALINLYRVCKLYPTEFINYADAFPYSRAVYRMAMDIYRKFQKPEDAKAFFTRDIPHKEAIEAAWAFWYLSVTSYSAKLGKSLAVAKKEGGNLPQAYANRKARLEEIIKRLDTAILDCRDALQSISAWDSPDTWHYCDPPYVDSECGHYEGYSWDDFEELLKKLSQVNGKFMLSSYPSEMLDDYASQHGWTLRKFDFGMSIHKNSEKIKTEVLTYNYEPLPTLFG